MNTLNQNNLPFVLLILDGLGINNNEKANAVFHAKTPNLDRLNSSYPNSSLLTHGERVGLPEGQMGNSEVGHLNIGAGRVVRQDLSRIGAAVKENQLNEIDSLKKICASSNAIHFVGLLSQGGVHSDEKHLRALVTSALELGAKRIYVHAITDGRDRPPQECS